MPKNNEFANKVKNSSHVSTSAHDTGKESPFEGAKVTGYIPVDMEMNPKYKYGVVNAVGDCLDSELSPIKIKDGDRLVVHSIPLTEVEIMMSVEKIVCIALKDGRCFVKQAIFYNVPPEEY